MDEKNPNESEEKSFPVGLLVLLGGLRGNHSQRYNGQYAIVVREIQENSRIGVLPTVGIGALSLLPNMPIYCAAFRAKRCPL